MCSGLTLTSIMGLVIGLPAFFEYFDINLDNTEGNQITGGESLIVDCAGTFIADAY